MAVLDEQPKFGDGPDGAAALAGIQSYNDSHDRGAYKQEHREYVDKWHPQASELGDTIHSAFEESLVSGKGKAVGLTASLYENTGLRDMNFTERHLSLTEMFKKADLKLNAKSIMRIGEHIGKLPRKGK